MKRNSLDHMLRNKLLFSLMILAIYIACGRISLFHIDIAAYKEAALTKDYLLLNLLGADEKRYSIFALGLVPYIWGNMGVQMATGLISPDRRKRISPKRMKRIMIVMSLLMAMALGAWRTTQLLIIKDGMPVQFVQAVNWVLLVAGAMFIVLLCNINAERGFGGATVIIIYNILRGLLMVGLGASFDELKIPLLFCLLCVVVAAFMEYKELRLHVLRVSIHNTYAEENYLAIKYNPVGVMPVVFSSVLFMVPQLLVRFMLYLEPYNTALRLLNERLVMTDIVGMIVYIIVVYTLTYAFAYLFLRPDELVDNYRKSGDCIENVRIGEPTKEYIDKRLYTMCTISATIMGACIAIPMYLQTTDIAIDHQLLMMPTMFLILTGMAGRLIREFMALHSFDKYKMFI